MFFLNISPLFYYFPGLQLSNIYSFPGCQRTVPGSGARLRQNGKIAHRIWSETRGAAIHPGVGGVVESGGEGNGDGYGD